MRRWESVAMYRILEKENFPFSADTDDIEVLYERYIYNMEIAVKGTVGTAVPSLSDVLSVLNKIEIKLKGATVTEVTGADLMALNCLMFGEDPIFEPGSAAGDTFYLNGIKIPMSVAAGSGMLAYRLFYKANANATSVVLNIERIEYDHPKEEGIYAIKRFDYTPPSTGAENIALDTTFDGELIAMLLYSPTIPTNTSDTATIHKVILDTGTTELIKDTFYNLQTAVKYPQDSTFRTFCQNYLLLDFRDNPIGKGERVRLKIVSDDTNSIRIIPVLKITS